MSEEQKMVIQSALKETLQEVLGDPDAGLELRPELEERLRQAVAYVASGGSLLSMEELASQLEDASDVRTGVPPRLCEYPCLRMDGGFLRLRTEYVLLS